MDKLHWSVDSLVLRNGIYFGFGWVFHEEQEILDLRLSARLGNGETQAIAANIGKPRGDVAVHFPNFDTAMHSGYVFFGNFGQDQEEFRDLSLQGRLVDGLGFELKITQTSVINLDTKYTQSKHVYMRQLITLFERGFHLLRSGKFVNLFEKAKRYLRGRPKSFLVDAETLQKKLNPNERQSVVLVIDHDLGGGANHYRDRLVADKMNKGATVLIFSYYVMTLSYILIVRTKRQNERFTISGYDFLLKLAELLEFKEIIYNTGVSFVHPEEIPQLIIKLKNQFNPRLTLLAHDFFMVCPSHFLLDDAGIFCGIPDISRCHSCLARNQQGFATLFQSRDMVQWRALWGNVIGLADEIRAFSNDTLILLQKAYPSLDLSRTVIEPHKMEHIQYEPARPPYTATLRIGVVGQIGYHKGAKFVQELAQEIKNRKIDIQIAVIGLIEAQCEKSVVSETGSYQHDQLPALIESSGANIILFPSIWPETFSYVVQELIELDLPVACFDLGAPAERLSNYVKGLILTEPRASLVLDELIAFHHRIYFKSQDLSH